MNPYNLRLGGSISVLIGCALLIEHIYRWGFEITDLIGHEWYGIIFIIVGIGLGILSRRKEDGT